MGILRSVDAIVMYHHDRLHPESDSPKAYSLNPLPNRIPGNELMHIPPKPPMITHWGQPALIAFGCPFLGYEKYGSARGKFICMSFAKSFMRSHIQVPIKIFRLRCLSN